MGQRRHAPTTSRAQKVDAVLADLVINSPTRRIARQRPIKVADSDTEESANPNSTQTTSGDAGQFSPTLLASIVDFSFVLSLVFGGCCSNVWAYEYLLKIDARIGTALTFSQMVFVTLTSLPSFIKVQWYTLPSLLLRHKMPIPSLKPRQVPLSQWALQVLVLTTGSLLNNWAFAFHVPLTVQIVFRSAGLAVSMLFGRLFLKMRYTLSQVGSVFLVTLGVMLATTSRPMPPSDPNAENTDHLTEYTWGITMLTLSLFLTGALGLLQEQTYAKYGPCWREGVFYTHALSLPIFALFVPQIKLGFASLAASAPPLSLTEPSTSVKAYLVPFTPYFTLAANLVTQLICVSGVNQLTSRVSSVSTNLVLTTRKALSLLFSVWWFGNGWNAQLGLGAGTVFAGSIIYALVANRGDSAKPQTATVKRKEKGKAKEKEPSKEAGAQTKVVKIEVDDRVKLEDNDDGDTVTDVSAEATRRQGLRRENGGRIGNGVAQKQRLKVE